MKVGLIYLFLIGVAELLTATITESLTTVRLGIILHSIILVTLILQGATTRQTSLRRLLLVLTLSPLIRILSISLPLRDRPLVDWYLIIGSLLFVGSFVTARITGISFRRMGFTWKGWPVQLAMGFVGVGLGITEYYILHPKPLLSGFDWGEFLYACFVLMVFTGLLEEFIFRGLVQEAAIEIMGRFGIFYGAVLFAVLHVGYLSVTDVLFVFAVGLLFGFIVQGTRSLLGVTVAHGMTNIVLYLVFPIFLVGASQAAPAQPSTYQEVLGPRDISTPLPLGTHFPGHYVTATPDPRTASPSPSPTFTLEVTSTSTETSEPFPSATSRAICGSPPAGWVTYTVRAGDNLSRISRAYGVSVAQLQTANCLSGTLLHTGQKLYVPNLHPMTPQTTASFEALSTVVPSLTTEPPTQTVPNPTVSPPQESDTPESGETP
jgi:membrane protease YdiL (CAAX protease family)/LysM repeat protein